MVRANDPSSPSASGADTMITSSGDYSAMLDDEKVTLDRIVGQRTRLAYYMSFVLLIAIAVAEILVGSVEDLILMIPVIIALGVVIFTDRKVVHIPQILILMLIITFLISLAGKAVFEGTAVDIIAYFLYGVDLALIGLIGVYTLLKSIPGVRDENPRMVTFMTLSVAIAVFSLMELVQYSISLFTNATQVVLQELMTALVIVIVGALVVCGLYGSDRTHRLFRYTLGAYLASNSNVIGLDGADRKDVMELIGDGESDKLEFKSTIRTNLQTGEVDKRMEKAVLKTLVAFMNSDGGTLLVGVADDGEIIGADLQSFESRDKMNLHITNIIASGIGNEFLPFIQFNMVDFDDRVVVRFKCVPSTKPVFLRDGKNEIFYVRSGPSSVEVTGMNLISYVNNRYRLKKMGKSFSKD